MGKEWVDFKKIFIREAVLDDSLFLRFMRTSITRNSNDFSKDFIVMKFSYDAEYRLESGEEQKMSKEELRTFYYKNGVTFQSAHTGNMVKQNLFITRCYIEHQEKQRKVSAFLFGTIYFIKPLII